MIETGILAKALAVLLTLGQLHNPQNIKMRFDKVQDRAEAVQLMNASCVRLMTKFKDVSGIDITKVGKKKPESTEEDSVVTALTELIANAKSKNTTTEVLKGLDVKIIKDIYVEICKGQSLSPSLAPVEDAIEFYNKAVVDLPSDQELVDLKNKKLNQSSLMIDGTGEYFSDIYKSQGRRRVIDFSAIPEHVKKAFTSIEDHRFYEHNGIDELGLLRAFFKNIISGGRPEGASTITQQVVKNLVVGDDITFERKIREMILAVRLDQGKILSKDEILALYLNYIYLGRSSWGVEMAAQSYFGKSIREVTLAEAAFLAGLTHSPNKYAFTSDNKLALARRNEVLSAIKKYGKIDANSTITAQQITDAEKSSLQPIPWKNPRAKTALYFADDLRLHLKSTANIDLYEKPYVVHATLHPELQKAVDGALQDGLWNYENARGLLKFEAPEGSMAEKLKDDPSVWPIILQKMSKPLVDVQWDLATVTRIEGSKIYVGLQDGAEVPLVASKAALKQWDLIFVKTTIKKNKKKVDYTVAELRTRPKVQGAAVVLENATGKILAMSGGFSYQVSELNRASMVAPPMRQAGSTVKPLVYLSALSRGFAPNTLVYNTPQTYKLPGRDWTPRNYNGKSSGPIPIRHALENSLNVPTAAWLNYLGGTREQNFDYIRSVMQDLGVYDFKELTEGPVVTSLYGNNKQALRRYQNQYSSIAMLLGTAPTRIVDLAVAYATIANNGWKPVPHLVSRVEEKGQLILQVPQPGLVPVQIVDQRSLMQIKSMLNGVLIRGTGRSLQKISQFAAGKTGTSSNNRDALFAGFTNEITVVVWVGYDKGQSLGSSTTGGQVAAPIFENILQKSWQVYKPATPLQLVPVAEGDFSTEGMVVNNNLPPPPNILQDTLPDLLPDLPSDTRPEDTPPDTPVAKQRPQFDDPVVTQTPPNSDIATVKEEEQLVPEVSRPDIQRPRQVNPFDGAPADERTRPKQVDREIEKWLGKGFGD